MSECLTNTIIRAAAVSDWLSPQRQRSLALLREEKWPTRKTEAWKYTSVRPVEDFQRHAATEPNRVVEAIAGLNAIDLVIVDGVIQTDIAALTLPVGLSIVSLADASPEVQAWASTQFSAIKPARHLFGLINDVLATVGFVIDVAEGVTIEQPLRIVHRVNAGQEVHSRTLLRLGEGAKASLIEHYSPASGKSYSTGFSEFDLAKGAELEHYRFALQTGEALNVGGSHFKLADDARLNSSLVGFGSELARLDVDVIHAGERAFAKLNAIYLLDGSEVFDLHSTIEHAQPNGTTDENVRGIVADSARAVFNGRIHIHRDAQKTLAELNNRNLLLSPNAEIYSKPELEIYADDVSCAHGATVAEIDKVALYYLQSRGVSKAQAQIMLSFGFINELVDQMPNQVLAEWLRPQLRLRFSQMDVK